jgi:clan AA aspartic protease (TIGR02281 family)
MINGKGPFDFIVDTGASATVITPTLARRAGVAAGGSKAKATGANGHMKATIARLKTLAVGPVEVKNLEVAVISLATLNRTIGQRIGGIIGYSFLKRFRTTIDYSARTVWLADLGASKLKGSAKGSAARS